MALVFESSPRLENRTGIFCHGWVGWRLCLPWKNCKHLQPWLQTFKSFEFKEQMQIFKVEKPEYPPASQPASPTSMAEHSGSNFDVVFERFCPLFWAWSSETSLLMERRNEGICRLLAWQSVPWVRMLLSGASAIKRYRRFVLRNPCCSFVCFVTQTRYEA